MFYEKITIALNFNFFDGTVAYEGFGWFFHILLISLIMSDKYS